MIDEYAKACVYDEFQWTREALVWKLDGLSEYDINRSEERRATGPIMVSSSGLRAAITTLQDYDLTGDLTRRGHV